MKVAVYLAAVPRKAKNQFKRDLLTEFAYGCKKTGDEVTVVDEMSTVDADIAVLQGWIGMKQAPHLELRQQVIQQQRQRGRHTLVIDSNLFGFLEPLDFNRYLRYSLDGIFPTTGYYFDKDPDPTRWQSIKRSYQFEERDWKTGGKHILICLQREGGWSMDGLCPYDWLADIIPKIRSATDRSIVIRGHPGSMKTISGVKKRWPDIAISDIADIRGDFKHAWATITYNSSPGVASLLWGVPAWITDPTPSRSQAYPWAATDLSTVDNPQRPDRSKFYQRLAQCHFSMQELHDGSAWNFMRSRLP